MRVDRSFARRIVNLACGIIFAMSRKGLRLLGGLVFSVGGLYLALRGVDGASLLAALRAAEVAWLLGALGFFALTSAVRAWRFRLLFNGAFSWGEALGIVWMGYALSNLLPLRVGDPARAVLVKARAAVPVWAALPVIALERALDLAAVALLVLATGPWVPALNRGPWGAAALFITLSFLTVLVVLPRLHVPLPPSLRRIFAQVQAGLAVLRAPRQVAAALVLTALLWTAEAGYFYAGLRAFWPAAPWLSGPVVTWASALGVATPAPGGVGPYHLAIRLALTQGFAAPEAMAVSYALVIHALQYLGNTLPGLAVMAVWGWSWRTVRDETTVPLEAVESQGGV